MTVTRASNPLAVPAVGSLTASGDDLSATFTWSGATPGYLRWELHSSTTQNGTYTASTTVDDSTSPVAFNDRTAGWYKVRGKACMLESRARGSQADEDGAVGESTEPVEICSDWSSFSSAVQVVVATAADASLSGLSLSGVTLSPAFASTTTTYTASVPHSLHWTTVTATPTQALTTPTVPGTSITITPADSRSTTPGHQVDLAEGGQTAITVTVTARDGTTRQAYTATVTRAANPLAVPAVGSLTASGDDLSATFTWSGASPSYLRWELHRSSTQTGTYAAATTVDDSTSPVEFSDRPWGWYKLRGKACMLESRAQGGSAQEEDGAVGENGAGGQSTEPVEVCGDWSSFSSAVQVVDTTADDASLSGLSLSGVTFFFYVSWST